MKSLFHIVEENRYLFTLEMYSCKTTHPCHTLQVSGSKEKTNQIKILLMLF